MSTKNKPLDGLFAQLQDIKDGSGKLMNTVLFSKNGNPSVIIEIENPVQQYATDAVQYVVYTDVLNNIVQTLGEGYALQKQDILCRQSYHHAITDDMEFLTRSYFRYFNGRPYTEIRTYLIITQEAAKSAFVKYDPKTWLDFHTKVSKVMDILKERGIWHRKLTKDEVNEYLHRFMAFHFKTGPFSMQSFKAGDDCLKMGDKVVKSFDIVDVDEIDLPSLIKPYQPVAVNGYVIATDLLSFLSEIPDTDCVIYNQVIQIPQQRKLLRKLQSKAKRHGSMPDPSNKIAKADIEAVLNLLAQDSKLLVYTNFNLLVSCKAEKLTPVTSFIETKLYECGIFASKSAYNQLELFLDSFPGNAYSFNPDYNLFLTLNDAALCLFFKEHLKHSEVTPLKTWYTDRQGLPTGDSYEGICRYFKGTYISYSKEKPISMNPFKITDTEYAQNFGEKKNFLKSLIFLIFKGSEAPTKIEDKIINQTIVEYYESYFTPFKEFTDAERDQLRKRLLLEDKKNGTYEKHSKELEEKYKHSEYETATSTETSEDSSAFGGPDSEYDSFNPAADRGMAGDGNLCAAEEKETYARIKRKVNKLHDLINDKAATDGEKVAANRQLMRLMPQLIEGNYLITIEQRIDRMEKQRRKMHVDNLSFNSYYEFAIERIPQIMREKSINFDIDNFAAILEQFYKGGELEHTLNNDVDASLFDEKFIVFEIDKIKDDPVLFPIVVLIIMDVFLQKMRIKKGRKALIIEEAWKAISSPTMAEYIKYLYKTVRKFHGIAGVVTQELNDVIDSPIVKEAIINNSDVKILLDQSKFKDRYDDISAILGLTQVQKQQIFTVNALNNHDGRSYFKEVWICRGQYSDVYGVEEPPECYWAYTTERAEKEALKVYERHYGDIQTAITKIEEDRNKLGIKKYLDFAVKVNQKQKIMPLWDKSD